MPDIWISVVDPYEEVCYGATTISNQERVLPLEHCSRGVILFSEDYAKLKKALYKNCIQSKCKQSVEVLDELFLTVDRAFADTFKGKTK